MNPGSRISGFFTALKAVGISIHIVRDDHFEIYAVEISQKRNQYLVKKLHEEALSIESLSAVMEGNQAVQVVLDGKGIIHRRIRPVAGKNPAESIFPAARKEDFLSQTVVLPDGDLYVSVIRKEQAEKIIQQLFEKGFKTTSLSLGPFVAGSLDPFPEDNTFVIPRWKISRTGNEILFEPTENFSERSVYVWNQPLSTLSLTAFAAAFQFLHKSNSPVEVKLDLINSFRKEEKYRKRIDQTGLWFLSVLFIILIVNFLVFQQISQTRDILSGELEQSRALLSRLDSLKAEYEQKSRFLDQSGIMDKTRYSVFADRIAINLPEKITLTKLDFNPLVSKPKAEQEIRYNQKSCILTGKVDNGVTLDHWLNKLRSEKWISDAELTDYRQDDPQMPAVFSIHVSIR